MNALDRAMQNALTLAERAARDAAARRFLIVPPEKAAQWEIGALIAGKGIYLGVWAPKDWQGKAVGNAVGKKFHVFAAPQDLDNPETGKRMRFTFKEAAQELGQRTRWYGHDGGYFEDENAVFAALQNRTYRGEWFNPTLDLLRGINRRQVHVRKHNLYALSDSGAFENTFHTYTYVPGLKTESADSHPAACYWSSTPHTSGDTRIAGQMLAVDLTTGFVLHYEEDDKQNRRLSCRPVRLEGYAI